jgi:hypothetical protein
MEDNGVNLKTDPIESVSPSDGQKRILVTAYLRLYDLPARDANGFIAVPGDARRRLEGAIETTAALIAVSAQCHHSISSPHPSVALIPENAIDRAFLDGCKGFDATFQSRPGISYQIKMTPEIVTGLADRREGLNLIAEAFAHDRALGRYRELMRFFELAFALPSRSLSRKLAQFLSSRPAGYTGKEVKSWCQLRHGSVHGDLKITREIVLEADIRPVIRRMEHAALDVLFNKKAWHNSSRTRRKLWKPDGVIAGPNSHAAVIVFQGGKPAITARFFDPFMAYPLDFSGIVIDPPDEWWYPKTHDASAGETDGLE